MLERNLRELQVVACIDFEDAPSLRQQIAVARSFGHPCSDGVTTVEVHSF